MHTKLQVMKFGGTSVGDAACIRRSAQIVANASREYSVAVVVSAMSGVTNRLIDAAHQAKRGDREAGKTLGDALRKQHFEALAALVPDEHARLRVECRIEELLAEGTRLYEGTALLRELTLRTLDAISSLGERLCAPVFAAALSAMGIAGVAIEATELIVTDSFHGGADPQAEPTRQRSQQRIGPLLQHSQIPVVTGFIGATSDGLLTTLGRGGSDYSATILGAALDAEEIIIWTDVEGVLTADPRLVAEARTIPEISYREAAELAYFGVPDVVGRTFSTTAQLRAEVLLISQSSSQNDICFIVAKAHSHATLEALRHEFAQDLAHQVVDHITMDPNIAIVAVVGENMRGTPGVAGRTFHCLGNEGVNIIAIAQGSSETNISFVVSDKSVKSALLATHREFALGDLPT